MGLEGVPGVHPTLPPALMRLLGEVCVQAGLLRGVRHTSEPSVLKMSECSLKMSDAPSACVSSLPLGRA